MLIGVVGAPNKGKSTFFSAATMADAQIAPYPFTTTRPNRGVTYVRSGCPHVALGLPKCDPKNSRCVHGVRLVMVGLVDVAGLVPGAHEGKGLGNKFLDNLREADALIQVVDGTGRTDLHGNPSNWSDPLSEATFLQEEIAYWLAGILMRAEEKNTGKGAHELARGLSGLKIGADMLLRAAEDCGLDISSGMPSAQGALALARAILPKRMPTVIAFNKIDDPQARLNLERVKKLEGGELEIFPCSAAVELALRKAAEHSLISYAPGDAEFSVCGSPDERQLEALGKMREVLQWNRGSGVQQAIDFVVRKKLGGIVVYPVEDEHKFCNSKGEVLPDALLVRKGTTALQLAGMVHTELAHKFIGAVDARRRIRVGAEHVLEEGDVIRIIAGR